MAWAPRLSGGAPSALDLTSANGYHLVPPRQRASVAIEEEPRRLRHGTAVLAASREPLVIEFAGHVRGSTAAETRSRRDALQRALGDGAAVTLRLRDSTGGELGRELSPCRLVSYEDAEILGSVHNAVEFRAELAAAGSFWRGTSDQAQTSQVAVLAVGTTNVALSNAGDAAAIVNAIVLAASSFAGSIRVVNTTTSKAWRLLGLLLATTPPDNAVIVQGLEGDIFRYDVGASVSYIGVAMDAADGTVFDLAPGTNNLQVEVASSLAVNLVVQFDWRPQFRSY